MRLLLAALVCSSASASDPAPDYQYSYSFYSAALRSHLLSTYDSRSPPTSMRFGNTSTMSGPSRAGADIGLQIRFFKVRGADLGADGLDQN